MPKPETAEESYDRFAAAYDECNAQNDYEMWVGEVILPELEKRGLQKGWVLDAGCGTGRAFEPLLARGWKVLGSDLSAAMLEEARVKFGSQVGLQKLDVRELGSLRLPAELPEEGAFDLILLLNDVLNYMTEDGDLEKAFDGVRRHLDRDHGLLAFDANTLSLFRHSFVSGALERDARGWEWEGLTSDPAGPVFEARLSGEGIEPHVHRQRHWTAEQVKGALEGAGFRCLAALGQREEGGRALLADPPDEERDHKVIYIASLAS